MGEARSNRVRRSPTEIGPWGPLDTCRNDNYTFLVPTEDGAELAHPLSDAEARKIIHLCLGEGGTLVFRGHALEEMAKDDLTEVDVKRVLRGGVVSYDSCRLGTHRYKSETKAVCVVVAFDAATRTVVVTAWKFKKRSR